MGESRSRTRADGTIHRFPLVGRVCRLLRLLGPVFPSHQRDGPPAADFGGTMRCSWFVLRGMAAAVAASSVHRWSPQPQYDPPPAPSIPLPEAKAGGRTDARLGPPLTRKHLLFLSRKELMWLVAS